MPTRICGRNSCVLAPPGVFRHTYWVPHDREMSTRDTPRQIGDLPPLGRPANSAFVAEGITSLEQAATYAQKDLLELHGVGPKAIALLAQAFEEHGLRFADE